MKKAILIAAGYDFPRRQSSLAVIPPLGILALGSYLAMHDVPVELIDVQMDFGFGLTSATEHLVCQRVAQYLQDQADSIAWIGISQLSNTASGAILAQEIHRVLPEIPLIFGGYFPSCNYHLLLQKYPFITAIVRGDGEATALQISQSLAQGQSLLCDQTPNLAWSDEEGKVHITPTRPVALEDLPILDFRLLHNKSCYQFVTIITSRGCPFSCNYCSEMGMRPYATYSTNWVARQLDHLEAELTNKRIGIADPIFGVNRKRTLEMCQVMRDRRFIYELESRVDVLTPDLIPLLRQVGVDTILWGVESASPATLLRMNKVRSVTQAERYLKDALEVLKACFENGVTPLMGIMLGFPGDSEADLQITLEFVREVGQLYNQIAGQVGVESGFIPSPHPTKIYDGSPLAERIAQDFPEVVLSPYSFDGEREVLSPSPGLDIDTVRRYRSEIKESGHYTPQILELINTGYVFEAKDFVMAHPELTDDQGVTVLCDSVRPLSR